MKRILFLLLPIFLVHCHNACGQLQTASIAGILDIHQTFAAPRIAQNGYLVTHNEIRQKIAEGYFTALNLAAIPQDNTCITAANAKLWLSIDETKLPTNGRLPLWQELVPKAVAPVCTGVDEKLVNGKCERGYRTIDSQEQLMKNGQPYCKTTYRVTWSDGSFRTYVDTAPGMCALS
ncbi:hypothetical protein [Chitinophaga varians]|uniref:hypothetical protein n=1 Tax=Chitinophaga varians TaxID=2202339 RepID=UPI00165F3C7E|nr:hypothetical protein [Chitinophaga varians]MBC9913361.1 hypothetical protein [Chitinophaga varians]